MGSKMVMNTHLNEFKWRYICIPWNYVYCVLVVFGYDRTLDNPTALLYEDLSKWYTYDYTVIRVIDHNSLNRCIKWFLSQWKETALHQAAKKDQVQVVETLHRLGADINASDNVSQWVLMK